MLGATNKTGCHVWRSHCFQRHPAVRLRREHWGGLAFHRVRGELLELDRQAFVVLTALSQATDLKTLAADSRGEIGHPARLPELARFLQELQWRGFVQRMPIPADSNRASAGHDNVVDRMPTDNATIAFREHDLSAPLVAHWAVTYRCNLACSFCYSESHPQREREPSADIRARIVARLADWGVFEVALGGGEPAILSDFPQLMATIRRHGMVPNVTTNGILKSAKVLHALAEHAGTVHLSADRSDLLDAARGEGISAHIKNTACHFSALGVRWGMNLLLTPQNADSLDCSLAELQEMGATAITLLRPKGAWAAKNWPGFPTARNLRAIASSVTRFLKLRTVLRLYVDTALRGEWAQVGLLDDPEPEVLGCGGGQRHVAITPTGDVYPCSHACRRELRMGSLLDDDLHELWRAGNGLAARQQYRRLCDGTTCPCQAL